jgi:transcriptional regulator with XRE-family HTH domain
MKHKFHLPIPVIRTLRKLGQDINDARRRRRITIELMAERANISRATISKIQKGDPSTSMGAYAVVLFVLGMTDRLSNLVDAAHDFVGRRLEDEKLPKRVRISNQKNRKEHE